jgi:cytochrome c biogenesis protein CcmG/thiol:disulfide interchange protein DsbE
VNDSLSAGRYAPAKLRWAAFALSTIFLFMPPLSPAQTTDNFSLEQYRGQVVWLDFWASWCTPCRRSFPWMNEMIGRYADEDFVIVGVNVDMERELAEEFLRETPASFPIVYDPDAKLAQQFGVLGMPSSYLIDRDGNVISSHIGFRRDERDNYESAIREALAD